MSKLKSILALLEEAKRRKAVLEEELEATDQAIEQLKQQAHEGALWQVRGSWVSATMTWTELWEYLKAYKLKGKVTSFGRIAITGKAGAPVGTYGWGSAWIKKEQETE